MSQGAVRRIAVVLIGYLVVAWLVLGVADWARPVLALPVLFPRLLRNGLAAGLPIALLLAWYYPSMGHHGADSEQTKGPDA